MRRDSYSNVARHYDRSGMDYFADRFGPKLIAELARRGIARGHVLDAGCGTGSLALFLANAGYTVTGVDLSDPMLAEARRKDGAGRVTWRHADLVTLDLGMTFDAITSVADVLSHIESDAEWATALRRLADHLAPGGVLFLDMMTLKGHEHMDAFTFEDRPDRVMSLGIVFEPAERRSTLKMTSFLKVPDSEYWERATQTITAWSRTGPEILEALRRVGLESFERPWFGSEAIEDVKQLMLFATKTRPR